MRTICTVLFVLCLSTKRPSDCELSGRRRRPIICCIFFSAAGKTAWDDYALGAAACHSFTTNAIYGLTQVKWFSTVIGFEPQVLPHCTAAITFGFETNSIFVYHSSNLNERFHGALLLHSGRECLGGRACRRALTLTPGPRRPTETTGLTSVCHDRRVHSSSR